MMLSLKPPFMADFPAMVDYWRVLWLLLWIYFAKCETCGCVNVRYLPTALHVYEHIYSIHVYTTLSLYIYVYIYTHGYILDE
jgi:hypothetical protein